MFYSVYNCSCSLPFLSNEVVRIFQFITKYKANGTAISLLQPSNSRKTIGASLLQPVIVFLNVRQIHVKLLYLRRILLIETGTILCIIISLLWKRNLLLTPSKSFLLSAISKVRCVVLSAKQDCFYSAQRCVLLSFCSVKQC